MTRLSFRAALLVGALPATLAAQEVRIYRGQPGEAVALMRSTVGASRLVLGVTLVTESDRADTLGIRISSVTPESPAATAGLVAGDRLQAINGVSLRADRGDAGQDDYDGVLMRRLQREMAKVEEGDTVTLRVLSEGRAARDVRVAPKPPAGTWVMAPSERRRASEDRAVIGVTTQPTGTPRDTLGVFVSAVTEDGPAAKAGIIEGDRIAAINGVSLRVAREDAGDAEIAAARAERLRSELEKVTPGTAVELTVVSAGRSRSVRVTPVKASDLPGGELRVWGFGTTPEALEETMARVRAFAPEPPVPPKAPAPPVAPAAPRPRVMIRDGRVL